MILVVRRVGRLRMRAMRMREDSVRMNARCECDVVQSSVCVFACLRVCVFACLRVCVLRFAWSVFECVLHVCALQLC
jgi:hypothetical protein